MKITRRVLGGILIGAAVTVGCGESIDPQTLTMRNKYLSARPISGERPVPDIRKELEVGTLSADSLFTIRARINAGEFSPFGEGQAAFLVTDATGHDGDESHDPHECPFCKRDIQSMMARVEFDDETGTVAKVDSRTLLGVKEFDLVVIEGRGRLEEDGTLIVKASRMFTIR